MLCLIAAELLPDMYSGLETIARAHTSAKKPRLRGLRNDLAEVELVRIITWPMGNEYVRDHGASTIKNKQSPGETKVEELLNLYPMTLAASVLWYKLPNRKNKQTDIRRSDDTIERERPPGAPAL